MIKRYDIIPIPKPRITARGKHSPAAKKYYKFAKDVRNLGIQVPECDAWIHFIMPMPKSWSLKKKIQMRGKPHQQTPDIDNLLKALLDAIYEDDKVVWDIRASKRWSTQGHIWVETNE
jgi:Holliday junction resolvase RusA-like endonuclease